ncbi:MAG TPA: hypothetical protein DDZ80_04535 [Cyanobacteria bacterium UBA8803]|nr:hypothetical protein [Cyanobacteria bacterium UBA9273]HBL57826.1 hypothetical protein [Cyanobacteria bacterium UBA8803]
MSETIGTMFGFLGGTIIACEGAYKVLQHPNPERTFKRLADAKWFLALRWCDQFPVPAGILNHEGQLAFYNEAVLKAGEEEFIPSAQRQAIFQKCLSQKPGEPIIYEMPSKDGQSCPVVEILGIDLDPRFGRVALVRKL